MMELLMLLAFVVVYGPDIICGALLALLWVMRGIFECVMAILIGGLELVAWGLSHVDRVTQPRRK